MMKVVLFYMACWEASQLFHKSSNDRLWDSVWGTAKHFVFSNLFHPKMHCYKLEPKYYFKPHFTDEKPEAQRGRVIWERMHGWEVEEPGFESLKNCQSLWNRLSM